MPYVALPRFLFRAPLLPLRALGRPTEVLAASALGAAAVELASPDLAAALARDPAAGAGAAVALDRYARRAAFRPTPHGYWAGVGVGRLGARSRVRTPTPVGVLAPAWARMASLGRALLEHPGVLAHVGVRRAPSLIRGPSTLIWLAPGRDDGFCEEHVAELDDALESVLDACAGWTSWPSVRAAATVDEADEVDDWLLTLVDDGVLHVDVVPPLVGPPAVEWMAARLARLPGAEAIARQLSAVRGALAAGEIRAARAALDSLPSAQAGRASTDPPPASLQGSLIFPAGSGRATSAVTLARAAIDRAATLAPLLFRMQEALAPPTAERAPGHGLAGALEAATEIFGAGALDVAALARGEYGTSPHEHANADLAGAHDDDPPDVERNATAPIIPFLVERMLEAARLGSHEVSLRAEDIAPLLPEALAPPTCELFVTPSRGHPGQPAGTGWLLGVHAPAGASWGRFATGLGVDGEELLADLRRAEEAAHPEARVLDVVFAPNARLAELCAHAPLRAAALALTGWPDSGTGAVTPADLELVCDPSALEPLALRTRDGTPVLPSPLHRVRSSTAPAGLWRLLVGWSLRRQHAPWALTFGALAGLARLPRVALDGFVVAPASWRIPAALSGATTSSRSPSSSQRRALARWRRTERLPRFVQVGSEDELLPVDLASREAPRQLAGHARAFEIWPPLADTLDASGRRIEAVIGLVDAPDAEARDRADASAEATQAAGAVPPPCRAPPAADVASWRSFKLFGATDRQDAVLADAVQPLIADARAAGAITGWFFQRYVEGPGRRPHLRLRVAGDAALFARALEARLAEARAAGDVVAIEEAPYFPEAARFGGRGALAAIHRAFEASSDLVLSLLSINADADGDGDEDHDADERLISLVGTHDALARAWGLDAPARRAFAWQRRAAHAPDVDEDFARVLSGEFRLYRAPLRQLLGGAGDGRVARLLRGFEKRARAADPGLAPPTRERTLAAVAHLNAVRLLGPDRDGEIRAYTFWERALESLDRHPDREASRSP